MGNLPAADFTGKRKNKCSMQMVSKTMKFVKQKIYSILAKLTFMLGNDRITSMKVKEKDKRNVSEQIIQFAIITK